MKTRILSLSLVLVVLACKKKETEIVTSETVADKPAPQKECFVYANGKDTVSLKLIGGAEHVTGELQYLFYEKDKSSGSVSGAFIGDTLYVDYAFQSEGLTSVREAVFVRKNGDMVPGYGEMEVMDGKELFRNPRKLTFVEKMTLRKTNCR